MLRELGYGVFAVLDVAMIASTPIFGSHYLVDVLAGLAIFAVAVVGPMARFVGRGYGHGVGLDQWSAKTMADQGYAAQRIVLYYYPGATLSTLPTSSPVSAVR